MLAKRMCSKKQFCWYISPFTKKKTNRYKKKKKKKCGIIQDKFCIATIKHAFNHHERASTTQSYMPTWISGSYKLADQIANTQSTDANRGSNETH